VRARGGERGKEGKTRKGHGGRGLAWEVDSDGQLEQGRRLTKVGQEPFGQDSGPLVRIRSAIPKVQWSTIPKLVYRSLCISLPKHICNWH